MVLRTSQKVSYLCVNFSFTHEPEISALQVCSTILAVYLSTEAIHLCHCVTH